MIQFKKKMLWNFEVKETRTSCIGGKCLISDVPSHSKVDFKKIKLTWALCWTQSKMGPRKTVLENWRHNIHHITQWGRPVFRSMVAISICLIFHGMAGLSAPQPHWYLQDRLLEGWVPTWRIEMSRQTQGSASHKLSHLWMLETSCFCVFSSFVWK